MHSIFNPRTRGHKDEIDSEFLTTLGLQRITGSEECARGTRLYPRIFIGPDARWVNPESPTRERGTFHGSWTWYFHESAVDAYDMYI